MSRPVPAPAGEALPDRKLTVDAVLAACGGDARAAIAALISDVEELERRLALTNTAVSHGFSRGWHHRPERAR